MNFQTFKDELIKNLKEDRVPTNGFKACTNILQLTKVTEIFVEEFEVEDDYNNPLQAFNLTVEKLIEEIGFEEYKQFFLKELLIHIEERPPHWNVDSKTLGEMVTQIKECEEESEMLEVFMEDDIYYQIMYRTIEKLITAN